VFFCNKIVSLISDQHLLYHPSSGEFQGCEMTKQRYTINVVEKHYRQDVGDEMDDWYHAYLALTLDTKDSIEVLQEIHFNEGAFGTMLPNVREKNSLFQEDEDIDLFPYISGDEKDILAMWNHALQHALEIKNSDKDIKFGNDYRHSEFANNCRTGVKSLIKTMGLTFCDEFTKKAAGIKAEGIPTGNEFSFDDNQNEDLDVLRQQNRDLVDALPPPQSRRTLSSDEIRQLEFI